MSTEQRRPAPSPGVAPTPGGKRIRRAAPGSAAPHQWPLLVGLTSAVAVLVAALAIALSLLSVASSSRVVNEPDPTSVPAGGPVATPRPAVSGPERRAKGRPDAPVLITEWFDYQCPGCGYFALNREPEIERQFVETGKARFVPRNFAFLGPESLLAAEAAEAAADQGRYWSYRTLLFQRQRGENLGAFRVDNLKRLAAELGLDQKAFNEALDRGVHREAILAERREAEALGVRGTPSVFVNGRLLDGVPTVEAVGKAIEEEIARKR